ncbi:hypothetical protein BKG93_08390 [Rodentibacter ratti]|uniref:Uncharacterized protein n=1 Tax=Rodentibacter ratti TaxID=1906745 RepID=A0A1V3L3J4_9PAST|nr:hypothetical protein [Rodentibacter ratti]OOF84180.1 hypothetical protein BKG93_08390 [Rodentibacter ratti]
MLSDKEIELLKKGAFGVTKDGKKVKFIGRSHNNGFVYAIYNSDGILETKFYDLLLYYFDDYREDLLNIVGLWKDKPEPFNLERALAGEPVLLRNGDKAFVKFQLGAPVIGYHSLVGYRINEKGREERCSWFDDGNRDDNLKIIGMWKEPEPVKPSADDLPKPIRNIYIFNSLNEVWMIGHSEQLGVVFPVRVKRYGHEWDRWKRISADNGCFYATEEDCQAVCNWLMNR